MPYDPTKPANNSPLSSLEMRGQLQSLNADTQTRATVTQMVNADNAVLQQTSANSNNVETLDISPDTEYSPAQLQAIIDAFNTLVTTLRR